MKLFEYCILYVPKPKKDAVEKALVLVDVTRVLAKDERTVQMQAARAIPADYLDKLEDVEIAVRPF